MNEIDFKKQELRKIFLKKRQELSAEEIEILSQKIAKNFINLIEQEKIDYKNKIFGSYVATKHEASPRYIEEFLRKNNCKICYPKIDKNNQFLEFIFSDNKNDFSPNKNYPKILEPLSGEILIPNYLLVPLLAFDNNSQRLGMGKGFYDKTIYSIKQKNPNLSTFGIAFGIQQSPQALPTSYNDCALDFVVTE